MRWAVVRRVLRPTHSRHPAVVIVAITRGSLPVVYLCDEIHFRRLKRIIRREVNIQEKDPSLIRRLSRTKQRSLPCSRVEEGSWLGADFGQAALRRATSCLMRSLLRPCCADTDIEISRPLRVPPSSSKAAPFPDPFGRNGGASHACVSCEREGIFGRSIRDIHGQRGYLNSLLIRFNAIVSTR